MIPQTPIGAVVAWPAGGSPPSGYLTCDGSAVSRTTYAALFAAIGTVNGIGNGSTTFNLPNLPASFIEGAGGADAPAVIGGSAAWAPPSHGHTPHAQPTATGHHDHEGPGSSGSGTWGGITTGSSSGATGATLQVGGQSVYDGSAHTHTIPTGLIQDGPHTHNYTGTYGTASGSNPDQSPPWFATDFIIRAA